MMKRIGVVVGAMLMIVALPAQASARDGRQVRIEDRCDPASFATIDVPCVKDGGVTLDEFLAKLNPQDGGHDKWRFKENHVDLKRGQALTATNIGGEAHTFTEVASFGAGFVPQLNAALPPGTPPAIPVNPDPLFVFPGSTVSSAPLSVGRHRFECLIHPWMRTVVDVSAS